MMGWDSLRCEAGGFSATALVILRIRLGSIFDGETGPPLEGVTRTTTGIGSECSSSAFGFLFLAVAVESRTLGGKGHERT